MYRPSFAEPKANLSGGSEQVECLCGSAVQFDFGSNRMSAVFFFECPRLKGLVGSVGYYKGFPQRKLKISYKLNAGPNHLNRDRGSVKPVGNSGDVVKVRGRDLRPEVPKGQNKILRTISQFMNRL